MIRTKLSPQVATIVEHLHHSLELLGGVGAFAQKGARVMLKPNIGTITSPAEARNTDPRVIEAVILLLREFGITDILIAESSIVGVDTRAAFAAMGLERIARQYNVELCDLNREPFVTKEVPNPLLLSSISISERLESIDTLVNLPKLKTISALPVSFGLKNLKGLIPEAEKKRFHHLGLAKALVDLGKVVAPSLTILDGIIASELYEPREANLIVAGGDVLAVDAVASAAIGLPPDRIEYLRLAQKAGIGTIDLKRIEICGDSLAEVQVPLQTAPTASKAFAALFPEVTIIDGNACSGCSGSLYLSLKTAKAEGLLDRIPDLKLVVGAGVAEIPQGGRVLCLGNCTKPSSSAHRLPGCPFISIEFCDLLRTAFLS